MTFTEARANVGTQLSDAALFEAPDTALFDAQIDSGSGSIAAGELEVPEFSTHITHPVNANVTVDFEIGIITGNFNQATGALTLEGEAGGTLTSEGNECIVSTDPAVLVLSTAGSSGGTTNPRSGEPFATGLAGGGAIAGQWTNMEAEPVGGDDHTCEVVEEAIEGPGGIWLEQEDALPPAAPQLTSTDPASPGSSGTPRILGTAETGSTVRVYRGPGCVGTPVASGSAAELGSPGIAVEVAQGDTAAFSATATDAAGNTSPCSAPISYTRVKGGGPPPAACIVPKLAGRTLGQAKTALRAANCELGKVRKPKGLKGKKRRHFVVKSSSPAAGGSPTDGKVDLRLGPKPRKGRH